MVSDNERYHLENVRQLAVKGCNKIRVKKQILEQNELVKRQQQRAINKIERLLDNSGIEIYDYDIFNDDDGDFRINLEDDCPDILTQLIDKRYSN